MTSVIAATIRRVDQPMPRPIHHSNAQLIRMGTMISSAIDSAEWIQPSGLNRMPSSDETNAKR
ncbi:MAG: hypothetical protein NT113_07750, partial [Hyphomicrobiales bacterium]|nr:hypothetical protein [Hyphomicrobiales bacterium]